MPWIRGHKTLYLLDNTQNGAIPPQLGAYPLRNAAAGEVSLCADLFETASLTSISRLRALLSALGFDAMQAMRVVTYLDFVRETERRLGNAAPAHAGNAGGIQRHGAGSVEAPAARAVRGKPRLSAGALQRGQRRGRPIST